MAQMNFIAAYLYPTIPLQGQVLFFVEEQPVAMRLTSKVSNNVILNSRCIISG